MWLQSVSPHVFMADSLHSELLINKFFTVNIELKADLWLLLLQSCPAEDVNLPLQCFSLPLGFYGGGSVRPQSQGRPQTLEIAELDEAAWMHTNTNTCLSSHLQGVRAVNVSLTASERAAAEGRRLTPLSTPNHYRLHALTFDLWLARRANICFSSALIFLLHTQNHCCRLRSRPEFSDRCHWLMRGREAFPRQGPVSL